MYIFTHTRSHFLGLVFPLIVVGAYFMFCQVAMGLHVVADVCMSVNVPLCSYILYFKRVRYGVTERVHWIDNA